MNISEFCIKRPVFATVLSLILIVLGLMGLIYLDTSFLPKYQTKRLFVTATYPGASAQLVETSVTTPLEDAVSGIAGVDTITSTSLQGLSQIELDLKDNADVDEAANNVRQNVNNARGQLPTNVAAPTVTNGGNKSSNIMDIGVIDPNMDVAAIRDYLQREVVNNIKQVPGIADVEIVGSNTYIMQVRLDPKKMAARKITVSQVQAAVQNSNIELPAGQIRGSTFNYPLTAATQLSTAQEFNDIVVQQNATGTVRISDIGNAKIAPDPTTDSYARVNGQPGVVLDILATDDANPIDAANGVLKYIASIKNQAPAGMQFITAYDQSVFMKNSIHEVYNSIIFSIFCVLVVIYLFLGQIRSVIIPIVTIPICIFATFGIMDLLGFTINIITLLALVLSIGLVVDDAIVMLENIHRHVERGKKPLLAAIKGSKEIMFAVIAMTLTLAAVYAPVGFVHGKVSSIFQPFALTLAGAVIVSGFVAITLSPMMCGRFLKPHMNNTKYLMFLDRNFNNLAQKYQAILGRILNKRYLVVITMVFVIIGGFFLFRSVPFTFMPQEDIGLVVGMVNTPSGANINYISQQTQSVSKFFQEDSAVQSIVSVADTSSQSSNMSFATLKPFDQRKESSQQLANAVNQKIVQVPGLNASAFPPSFGGSMKDQLEFAIMGNKSYDQLYRISQDLIKKLSSYPGMKNITSSLTFDSQQYEVHVNRDLAAKLNVSVKNIDNVIATMLSGINVSTIDVQGQSYDVYILGLQQYQYSLSSLNEFYVPSETGQLIPISNLVTVKPILSQIKLEHDNRARSATIGAQLGSGYELGTVISYLNKELPKLLPSDVHFDYQGLAKDTADSNSSMGLIFLLALVFIYLVLAAQFESFLDPLVILLAVPFSVIGAMFALKLMGGSINIYTIVGLVTLIGLIAKHGILITQFTNELKRNERLDTRSALIKAASIRLRPILMTTAAMIFGAIPLVFTSGASAESRQQIGAVIISGLFFGTFFSLIVVPVTYSFMDSLRQRFRRKPKDSSAV